MGFPLHESYLQKDCLLPGIELCQGLLQEDVLTLGKTKMDTGNGLQAILLQVMQLVLHHPCFSCILCIMPVHVWQMMQKAAKKKEELGTLNLAHFLLLSAFLTPNLTLRCFCDIIMETQCIFWYMWMILLSQATIPLESKRSSNSWQLDSHLRISDP
ncbi:unnamed protein product [Musa acuminata subsp. malaccensis]|uniref:(wild Malaysian banana) hypothetical protein n=1 Tax=Musa acuminata subsp. malaccensis TaxID=214687 RepID=A0A804KL32_MUSAM|nr:unnamed protein product [Musa acuminata subsp. malaccensis]